MKMWSSNAYTYKCQIKNYLKEIAVTEEADSKTLYGMFTYLDPLAPGTRLRKEVSPTMQTYKYVSNRKWKV